MSDSEAFPNLEWGTPLSVAEAADPDARLRIEEVSEPVVDRFKDDPSYGGAWFDQLDAGAFVLQVTARAAHYRQDVESLLPPGTRFRVELVDRTLSELTAERNAVSSRWSELNSSGVTVISAAVDVPSNRVVVGLLDVNEGAREAIRALAPTAVVRRADPKFLDACEVSDCDSVVGGIKLDYVISGDTYYCTSGYVARRTVGSHSNLVLVTAGHGVWESTGSTANWKHDGVVFGEENATHGFLSGSFGDVGFIDYDLADEPDPTNRYLAFAGGPARSINGSVSFSNQVYGKQVCRMGTGSYFKNQADPDEDYAFRRCGTITVFDTDSLAFTNPRTQSCSTVPNPDDCRYIHHMKVVSFDSWAGDSGGTVVEVADPDGNINTTRLLGTHVHSESGANADEGWYTTRYYGWYELSTVHGIDLELCVDANC